MGQQLKLPISHFEVSEFNPGAALASSLWMRCTWDTAGDGSGSCSRVEDLSCEDPIPLAQAVGRDLGSELVSERSVYLVLSLSNILIFKTIWTHLMLQQHFAFVFYMREFQKFMKMSIVE